VPTLLSKKCHPQLFDCYQNIKGAYRVTGTKIQQIQLGGYNFNEVKKIACHYYLNASWSVNFT
jgi:hypothetical protein